MHKNADKTRQNRNMAKSGDLGLPLEAPDDLQMNRPPSRTCGGALSCAEISGRNLLEPHRGDIRLSLLSVAPNVQKRRENKAKPQNYEIRVVPMEWDETEPTTGFSGLENLENCNKMPTSGGLRPRRKK